MNKAAETALSLLLFFGIIVPFQLGIIQNKQSADDFNYASTELVQLIKEEGGLVGSAQKYANDLQTGYKDNAGKAINQYKITVTPSGKQKPGTQLKVKIAQNVDGKFGFKPTAGKINKNPSKYYAKGLKYEKNLNITVFKR